jgi:hypothetical protein
MIQGTGQHRQAQWIKPYHKSKNGGNFLDKRNILIL